MCMLAFAFLQHLRLGAGQGGEKKGRRATRNRATTDAVPTRGATAPHRRADARSPAPPAVRSPHHLHQPAMNVAEECQAREKVTAMRRRTTVSLIISSFCDGTIGRLEAISGRPAQAINL
jgi:hypothetical protein